VSLGYSFTEPDRMDFCERCQRPDHLCICAHSSVQRGRILLPKTESLPKAGVDSLGQPCPVRLSPDSHQARRGLLPSEEGLYYMKAPCLTCGHPMHGRSDSVPMCSACQMENGRVRAPRRCSAPEPPTVPDAEERLGERMPWPSGYSSVSRDDAFERRRSA
jgi:hypothetical protein